MEYYLEHMPLVAARENHALAQLIADFREMFFPRYLGEDPNPPKEKPRPRKAWTVLDTLPPHARYDTPSTAIPDTALDTLRQILPRLPLWARALAEALL